MVHTASETVQIMGGIFLVMVGAVVLFALTNRTSYKHKIAKLPRPMPDAVKAKYLDAFTSRVETETRCKGGEFTFDLFVRQDDHSYVVRVSPDGTLRAVARADKHLVEKERCDPSDD